MERKKTYLRYSKIMLFQSVLVDISYKRMDHLVTYEHLLSLKWRYNVSFKQQLKRTTRRERERDHRRRVEFAKHCLYVWNNHSTIMSPDTKYE